MDYCAECERWFQNAAALRQHRENSNRHTTAFYTFGSTTGTTPTALVRAVSVASSASSASGFGMARTGLFGTLRPSEPATRTAKACATADDDAIDTSKILIDSLKRYVA